MSRYKEPYTLYKRGKYWYFRTYDANGQRTSGCSTRQTNKTLARDFCERLYLKGELLPSSTIAFQDYSKGFFDEDSLFVRDRMKKLSPNTLKTYRSTLNTLVSIMGTAQLREIDANFLKKLRADLIEKGLSPSHINLLLKIVNFVTDRAVLEGRINKDPFFSFKYVSTAGTARDAFRLEELKLLIKSSEKEYIDFFLTTALLGLRKGERLALSPESIQTASDMKYVKVDKQIDSRGVLVAPKDNSKREVPVISELIPYITPVTISYDYLAHQLQVKIKELGIDTKDRKLTLHSLRHFFVSSAKAYGVPDFKVELLAGHRLQGMAAQYTHLKAEDMKEILGWQKYVFDYVMKE